MLKVRNPTPKKRYSTATLIEMVFPRWEISTFEDILSVTGSSSNIQTLGCKE